MTVRFCTKQDISLIATVEKTCFADFWTENTLEEEFAETRFFAFLAEEEGELLGYVCGSSLYEDSELLRIAVLPQHRGKGIGKRLAQAMCDEAKTRGAERVFLEVRFGNLSAVKLYEGCGFAKTRLRKKYYADGEDALEMKKDL